MSRLTVSIDPALLEEARVLAHSKTKREALDQALREFVQRRRLAELADLRGSDLVELAADEIRRWRDSAATRF